MTRRTAATLSLFITVCVISVSSAGIFESLYYWGDPQNNDSQRNEEENKKMCSCTGPSCTCCVDFDMKYISLGGPGCVEMKYISKDEGIAVNVSYGSNTLHSEVVKGPNPKPTCMSLLTNIAHVCANFLDMTPTSDGLNSCLQLDFKLLGDLQTDFDMGCFSMNEEGMKMNNLTFAVPQSTEPSNTTEVTPVEANEELMETINETAAEGFAFIERWLGLSGGKVDANNTTDSVGTEDTITTTS